ncbi:MAG: hypothetical protein ACP5H2_11375 [Solirubrobacteraceae bacterium]
MDDLVQWVARLFDDCRARALFGVVLQLDRAEPPLVAAVSPADMPTGYVTLDRSDIAGRIDFACRLQAFLDVALDQPVPGYPTHHLDLAPTRVDDEVVWRCPQGDFRCEVGEYELAAFWPPTQAYTRAAPLLAKRFDRYGVVGLSSFGVQDRDGQLVARVSVRPEADDELVRAAASPLELQFIRAPAISTAREWHPASDREPAHETLTLTGVAMRLARLDGVLRRAPSEDECDFLVGNTRVRLEPAHLTGDSGSPLLMDADGVAFANEGDQVSCGGGYLPHEPVRTARPSIFHAAQISVYPEEQAAQRRPAPAITYNPAR